MTDLLEGRCSVKIVLLKAAITERNRWMVENCDLLIAHLVHERGGAWTAIRMAEKTKKTIVKI